MSPSEERVSSSSTEILVPENAQKSHWSRWLPGSRFLWRLYGSYALLILFATATLGVLVARRLEEASLADFERELDDKVHLFSAIAEADLRAGITPGLQVRTEALGVASGTRLTLILEDGTVVADSEAAPTSMNRHRSRPEVLAAAQTGYGVAVRHSVTVDRELMYVARPLCIDGVLVAYVRCSKPISIIASRVTELRNLVGLVAVITAFFALVIGYVVWRRIARPLLALSRAAEAFAGGELSHPVRPPPLDEVEHLARTFNDMAAQLRDRMEIITTDRNKLLAILGGMVEGVIAVDRDHRVLHMNDVAGRLLGVEAEPNLGRPISEVCGVAELRNAVVHALTTGQYSAELRMSHRIREQIVNLRAAALLDAAGRRAGAVLVLHDVTELRQLPAMRRDFVANVSHELKTPITAIRGLVETLLDDEAMPAETRGRFLTKIQNQSLRLSTLVSDLLSLSRIESQADTERIELDLRVPYRNAAAAQVPNFDHMGVTLRVEVPQEPVRVMGDPEGLRQIANNLLENALNYTPDGGRVDLTLAVVDGQARLDVRDSGIGIAPKHHARIFERFYRADKARSRELGGTGLGLSIVKHLTLAHGGEVSVESEPGKGSLFRVVIPLLVPEAERAEPRPVRSASGD